MNQNENTLSPKAEILLFKILFSLFLAVGCYAMFGTFYTCVLVICLILSDRFLGLKATACILGIIGYLSLAILCLYYAKISFDINTGMSIAWGFISSFVSVLGFVFAIYCFILLSKQIKSYFS